MSYRWHVWPADAGAVGRLRAALDCSELLARCLWHRGVREPEQAQAFLRPRLTHLADPFLLPDMPVAVARLFEARARAEPVVLFGDYDVDGVTATVLLEELLSAFGWRVAHHLPHRLDDGYGLSRPSARKCLEQHRPALLIAIDCGSTSVDTIQWLGAQGVDVLVLDHHQLSGILPPALAVVNPRRTAEAGSAERDLCSVGLAFKLAHALTKEGRRRGLPEALACDLKQSLDLVAVGTVADLVPLAGENRILVARGLERLSRTKRAGLRALMTVAQTPAAVGAYEVGFQLGPRLNAAGRLETATEAFDLLRARDSNEALRLARKLDAQNRERQRIERTIAGEVLERLRATFNPEADWVIVEGHARWHIGVVGIVASRVQREFHRPSIILGGADGEWRGSGRSIEGFDLAGALGECGDLLLRYGGHAMAAGLSIRPDRVEALRRRLNEIARRRLSGDVLRPELRLDWECSLSELGSREVDELRRIEPVGQGNPPAQVVVAGLRLRSPPEHIGRDRLLVRLWDTDRGRAVEVMAWNWSGRPLPDGAFDLACAPELHTYAGRTAVRLRALDWRPSASGRR